MSDETSFTCQVYGKTRSGNNITLEYPRISAATISGAVGAASLKAREDCGDVLLDIYRVTATRNAPAELLDD